MIGNQLPGGIRNEHVPHLIGITDPHLLDARIIGARGAVGPPDQVQLILKLAVYRGRRHGIEIVRRAGGGQSYGVNLRGSLRDVRGDAGGLTEAFGGEVVRIGVTGLLARDDAYAAAERNAFRGALDQRLIHLKRGSRSALEIEVRVVAPALQGDGEIAFQVPFNQSVGIKEESVHWRRHL